MTVRTRIVLLSWLAAVVLAPGFSADAPEPDFLLWGHVVPPHEGEVVRIDPASTPLRTTSTDSNGFYQFHLERDDPILGSPISLSVRTGDSWGMVRVLLPDSKIGRAHV